MAGVLQRVPKLRCREESLWHSFSACGWLLWGLLTAEVAHVDGYSSPKSESRAAQPRDVITCTISPSILSRCGSRYVRKTNYVIFFTARPSYLAEKASFPNLSGARCNTNRVLRFLCVFSNYSHFFCLKVFTWLSFLCRGEKT